MKNIQVKLIHSVLLTLMGSMLMAQVVYPPQAKKLIEFSHHSPTIGEYEARTSFFEQGPFEGISVKPSAEVAGGNIFMVNLWDSVSEETKLAELQTMRSLSRKAGLEENMLVLFGASQLDWFSDDQWRQVEEHLRFAANLCKTGGFRGILWDPEPYKPGKNPWRYSEQPGSELHSWFDYYIQLRKRGAQFIQIIQDEYPGLVIFSLREFSDFQSASPFSQNLIPVKDLKEARESLEGAWWSLHLPFTLGIMEAIDEDVTFIDGNEEAYYYTSALEYFQARNIIFNEMRSLIPAGLHKKYKANYYLGHAVSTDYIAGNWAGVLNGFPLRLSAQGKVLSPEEKALWFEHNMYYALRTADEYVWLYTEKPNWFSGEQVPEGFLDALLRAKEKIKAEEALGFSVEAMLEAARDEAERKYK